jgi:hypothetical protein
VAHVAGEAIDPTPERNAVYAALWLGALLLASGTVCDPFPAEPEQLAMTYFEPAAKA